jgi:hypothetical protein
MHQTTARLWGSSVLVTLLPSLMTMKLQPQTNRRRPYQVRHVPRGTERISEEPRPRRS